MNENKKWLIVSDLDGTFLDNNHNPTSKNIEIAKKLLKQGHFFCLVTGRPWAITEKIYKKLNIALPVGNFNGSLIHNPSDSKFKVISNGLNSNLTNKIFDYIYKNSDPQFEFLATKNDIFYKITDPNNLDSIKFGERSKKLWADGGANGVEVKSNFSFSDDVFEIVIMLKTKKDAFALKEILENNFSDDISVYYWDNMARFKNHSLQINHKNGKKGLALEYLAKHFNVSLENTIAFGDAENDLSMLEKANVGVAMKNATEFVLSKTQIKTDFTNDESGVGLFLEKFFDI